ncbi:MAG: hypothetical protein MZV49_05390 [Rhodopseudomonas palustris]|nr:hypothetical protein [Rhodopseudomonas palustris]
MNQYGSFHSPAWFNCGLHHIYGVGKNSSAGNWHYDREDRRGRARADAVRVPAVQRLLHPVGRGQHGEHHAPGPQRGDAVQVRLRHRHRPLAHPRPARRSSAAADGPAARCRFLKVYDQVANVVKSGGKTRRAAKMNTLRDWHGDIEEFIDAKQKEEKKAWALIEQGYDGSFNGDAYGSVMYQNENLSVRVSDEFMQAALDGKEWWTRTRDHRQAAARRRTPRRCSTRSPRAPGSAAIPACSTTAPSRSGTPARAPSRSTPPTPAREYVFLNNTACNLASLNLMKFKRDDGTFDVERFKAAVRIFITAQEILVDNASYPTKEIAENSHIFRTLGLGYANLGSLDHELRPALRLRRGPRARRRHHRHHDRPRLRAVSADMAADRWAPSTATATPAAPTSPSRCAKDNVESMLGVIQLHRDAVEDIQPSAEFNYLKDEAAALLGPRARAGPAATATATPRSPCSRPPAPSRS